MIIFSIVLFVGVVTSVGIMTKKYKKRIEENLSQEIEAQSLRNRKDILSDLLN